MPYRVKSDGTIEVDTAEEAFQLSLLLRGSSKPSGKTTKRKPRKLPAKEPSTADVNRVKLGQVWKATGGNSKGRVIQVIKLLKERVEFKVLENAPGKKSGRAVPMLYSNLKYNYKLEKDV